jgi:hypothetical protein
VAVWVVLHLLAAAAVLRVPLALDPPLDRPTRQYHSALIARGWYYENLDGVPADIRDIAVANGRAQGRIEPPFMEALTVLGYRAVGSEPWWVPRMIAATFWIAGSVALWLVGRRLGSAAGATVATAFYLPLAPDPGRLAVDRLAGGRDRQMVVVAPPSGVARGSRGGGERHAVGHRDRPAAQV